MANLKTAMQLCAALALFAVQPPAALALRSARRCC
jgi:hypothetical protein